MHVGVRFDDAETLRRAQLAYAEWVVEDPMAVDDLSMVLHPPIADGAPRRRPSLRQGGCDCVRSGSSARLLRALDCFLASLGGVPEGCVSLEGMGALVSGQRASLVPTSLLERSSGVERRIVEEGAALADGLSVLVDPVAHEVVVRDGLAGDDRVEISDDLLAAPGRYPLAAVHWLDSDVIEPQRRAVDVVRLLRRASPPSTISTQEVLEGFADLALRVSSVRVRDRGASDLDAVLAVLRA